MSNLFQTINEFFQAVKENIAFVLQFLGIAVLIFLIAYVADRIAKKKAGIQEKVFTTRMMAMVGMFSAIAAILMLFEIPLPFLAPFFYKIDLSEVPAMIATFAFGPVAGVMVVFFKVVLNLFINSTTTVFVGEFANFMVGCSLILPAAIVYEFKKTKKNAITAMAVGTIAMTIFGSFFNAVYLLPTFSKLYGMELDALIAFGTAINPNITNVTSFVILAVAPFNLIKGIVVSIVTMIIYKPLSPIIKSRHQK